MSYLVKDYELIKGALHSSFAETIYDYLLLKRKVQDTLIKKKYYKKSESIFGHYGDNICDDTWCIYGDPLCDVILHRFIPSMSELCGQEVIPTYSYARLYKKGDKLSKHTDRVSCKVSCTIFIGGDTWPIYLKENNKNVKIDFEQGDMLVYDGRKLPHWRNKFKDKTCAQLFLHYGFADNPADVKNAFDKREHYGLPVHYYSEVKDG
jgi:hypothetical protein